MGEGGTQKMFQSNLPFIFQYFTSEVRGEVGEGGGGGKEGGTCFNRIYLKL